MFSVLQDLDLLSRGNCSSAYFIFKSVFFCRCWGPQTLCVCVAAACSASKSYKKTRPQMFGACIFWMLLIFVEFHRFQGPPNPLRLCRSCLRRFKILKKTSLEFRSMYLMDFVDFRFQGPRWQCGSAVVWQCGSAVVRQSLQSSSQVVKQSSSQVVKQSSRQVGKQASSQVVKQSSSQAVKQSKSCGTVKYGS